MKDKDMATQTSATQTPATQTPATQFDAQLDISQDVLFGITQLALGEVEGLTPMTPPVRVGEILTGRRAKGIQIEREGERVRVDLTICVRYGLPLPAVAGAAQRAVREAVGSMTGLKVESVNVTVGAIDIPEELMRGAA